MLDPDKKYAESVVLHRKRRLRAEHDAPSTMRRAHGATAQCSPAIDDVDLGGLSGDERVT
jgi:hypothetical protein